MDVKGTLIEEIKAPRLAVTDPVAVEEIIEEDVFALLDELITDGKITGEFEITPKLKVTLQTLSNEEVLEAESVNFAIMEGIPKDVIDRVRIISTLAYATVAINNTTFITSNVSDTYSNRDKLRDKYMKMPPAIADKIYLEYIALVNKVNNKIMKNVGTSIQNF